MKPGYDERKNLGLMDRRSEAGSQAPANWQCEHFLHGVDTELHTENRKQQHHIPYAAANTIKLWTGLENSTPQVSYNNN